MNLFFIHTPFQLLAAQNLIIKMKLKSSVVILSNTGPAAQHFYPVFDTMLLDNLWLEKYKIGDLTKGVFSFQHPFTSYYGLIKLSKEIKGIILKHSITSLYFGDINHPAYIFLAEKWHTSKSINFFEEGISHYHIPILKKKFERSAALSFKSFLTDKIIFASLGVHNFSKYNQATEDCDFNFKISKKYNLLPVTTKPYDKVIDFDVYFSEAMEVTFKNAGLFALNEGGQLNVLYLSTSATYLFTDPLKDEIAILVDTLNKLHTKYRFLIKFHPKDTAVKKTELRKYFKDNSIDFVEIFPEMSFPVELLFNKIKIDVMLGYGSSSQLYFEQFCRGSINYNLFHSLRNYYREENINNAYPEDSWQIWMNMFKQIFNKQPLELQNEEDRHHV